MTLRARIFFLVTLIIMVVLVISLLLVVKIKNKPVSDAPVADGSTVLNQGNNIVAGTVATVIPPNVQVRPVDGAASDENTVRQLAKIFVERFHTYSSDNMYQNIRDVETMVTADYWEKISLPLTRPINPPPTFVALTTRVLAITSSNVQTTMATVVLKAQRTSTNGSASTVGYVDYTISLEKSGSKWLVVGETEKKSL